MQPTKGEGRRRSAEVSSWVEVRDAGEGECGDGRTKRRVEWTKPLVERSKTAVKRENPPALLGRAAPSRAALVDDL